MKRFLALFFFFFLFLKSEAQVGSFNQLNAKELTVGEKFYLPVFDTVWTPKRPGALTLRPQDSLVYRFNGNITGKKWDLFSLSSYTFSNGIKESGGSVTAGGYYNTDSISYISNSSKIFRIQSRVSSSSLFYSDFQAERPYITSKVYGGHALTYAQHRTSGSYVEAIVYNNGAPGAYGTNSTTYSAFQASVYNGTVGRMLQVTPTSVYFSRENATFITNKFEADSSIHYVRQVYDTYDSANYTALTLIPKQYLEDRLAGIGSGSTVLNNVGTGFDLAQQGTDNVKRIAEGFGIKFDSTTTANTVIIEVDSVDVPTRTEFIDSIENVKDLITQNVDSSAARVRSGTYATRIAISSPEDGEIFTQTDRLSGMYIYNQGTWRFQGDPLYFWYYTNFTRGQTVNTAAEGYNTGPLALTGAASSDFIVNQKPYSDGWLRALLKASDVTVTVPGFDSLEVDSVIIWHETEILVDAVSDGTDSYGVSWGYDNAAGTYTSGDRIVLRYNHAASSGNWESRTVAAGSGTWTTKDTGVPFVAGTRMKLAIEIDGYARVIRFYINDALVTTHTSPDNVPFPNATTLVTGISPSMFNFDRLAGSTTRSFEINYMFGYIIKKNF